MVFVHVLLVLSHTNSDDIFNREKVYYNLTKHLTEPKGETF